MVGIDLRFAFALSLTIVTVVVLGMYCPSPVRIEFWQGLSIFVGFGLFWSFIVIGISNYFWEYKDEKDIRCRIFGHFDKKLGKRTKILYPTTQPNDLFEYTEYQCRWCGKIHDGEIFDNISARQRIKEQTFGRS
jgi:hypothetical protein